MSAGNSHKLPLVRELRAQLDYDDPTLPRCKEFYEECRTHLGQYVDANGVAGKKFCDRASWREIQAVEKMAEVFLDEEGKGEYFWPTDPHDWHANTLRYSTNRQHIKTTLQLLFFKLNQQSRGNQKKRGLEDGPFQPLPARRDPPPTRNQSARVSHAIDRANVENSHHRAKISPKSSRSTGVASSSRAPNPTPVLDEPAAVKTPPGKQIPKESPVQNEQRPVSSKLTTQLYTAQKARLGMMEMSALHKTAQEACTGLGTTQSESTTSTETLPTKRQATETAQEPATSAETLRTKRRTTEIAQDSSKRLKGQTILPDSFYQPDQTSQRKSNRPERQVYNTLSLFNEEDATPNASVRILKPVYQDKEEREAASEVIHVAPEAAPKTAAGMMPSTMLATGPSATEDVTPATVFDAESEAIATTTRSPLSVLSPSPTSVPSTPPLPVPSSMPAPVPSPSPLSVLSPSPLSVPSPEPLPVPSPAHLPETSTAPLPVPSPAPLPVPSPAPASVPPFWPSPAPVPGLSPELTPTWAQEAPETAAGMIPTAMLATGPLATEDVAPATEFDAGPETVPTTAPASLSVPSPVLVTGWGQAGPGLPSTISSSIVATGPRAAEDTAPATVFDAGPETIPTTAPAPLPVPSPALKSRWTWVTPKTAASRKNTTKDVAPSTVFSAVPETVPTIAPVPLPATSPPALESRRTQAVDIREEQALQPDLARETELRLAGAQKAPEVPFDALTTNRAANVDISLYLFSRLLALQSSGTPEERQAKIADIRVQSPVPQRHTGPPPSELKQNERQGSYSAKETTTDASDGISAAQISAMGPELPSSQVTPQRSTAQVCTEQDTAKAPKCAPAEQELPRRVPKPSYVGPPSEPQARSKLGMYVIYGPKAWRELWTPTVPFLELTMEKMKEEMPFQLSPDFRGFKILFIGEGQRSYWELHDGNDEQLRHLQMDVEEVMDNWKTDDQKSGKVLYFQLRIEELRDVDHNRERPKP